MTVRTGATGSGEGRRRRTNMERLTYFDGGKWRLKIGDTEYSGEAVDRFAAYEATGLEPEDIVALTRHPDFAIADYYKSLGLTMERITELAQADKEGRVRIEEKTYQCPKCGAYRLTPRLDNQYYFCFKCKTQFTKEQAEAALRREQG